MRKYNQKAQRPMFAKVSVHFGYLLVAAFFITAALPQMAEAVNAKLTQYSKAPQASKISVNLLALEKKAKARSISFASAAQNTAIQTASGGILLDIVTNRLDAAVLKKISIPGVSIRYSSVKYNRVSVAVNNPALLYQLANIPEIRSIRPEYGARTHVGAVTSRAAVALKSDIASATFGLDGTGQKVGLLSDSFACDNIAGNRDFNTLPAAGIAGTLTGSPSQDTFDLPASVQILSDLSNPAVSGCADEGAAMGELVHDIAPGASLAFASAFISEAAFAQGITDLCSAPVNSTVVVDDVSYFDEPMYQDGIVGQAAAACVASGVPYFSAAGNGANNGYRQVFSDINPLDDQAIPPSGNDLHNWAWGLGPVRDGFIAVTLQPGQTVLPVLQWNQPYDSLNPGVGSQIDMDLLITATPNVAGLAAPLAASFSIQGSTGFPAGDSFEFASYTNMTFAPMTVYVAVDHFSGSQAMIPQSPTTPVEFRIVFEGNASARQGITDGTSAFGGPTVFGHPIAPGVTSVAAVPWFDTALFDPTFMPTLATDPEPFTSRGGTITTQFDTLGQFAPRSSFEPDIASVDGNNTTFFGGPLSLGGFFGEPDLFPNFFGTSAAAPNAAAVAALMRQRNAALTPLMLNTALENTAIDIVGFRAAPGVDDVTGKGLIDANAAMGSVGFGFIGLSLNGNMFNSTLNKVMTVTATTTASNPPTNADIYIALQLPGGTLLVMQPGGSFSAALTPLLSNISVPDFNGPIFSYTFTGAEPVGTYTWIAALTQPGTMNVIGTMAMVPVQFTP